MVIFMYSIYALGIMSAVISFLGFLLENAWLACTKGYIDNRNMSLPFLYGYGMAVISIYAFFGTPQDMILLGRIPIENHSVLIYFAVVFFAVSVGEIALGTAVEKLCGFEYWNYSRLPLHVTKYTSVFTSLGFAAIITLFMRYAFSPVMNLIQGVNTNIGMAVSLAVTVIMSLDFIKSFAVMHRKHALNERWRLTLSGSDGERKFIRNTI